MRAKRRMRFGRSLQAFLLAAVFAALVPRAALALDYFDGRLQIHGFYEAQIRAISRDFSDDLDLTQWYNVLNVEIEADIAPDGWGPFDLVQAFGRVEVRYDCVWSHACSLFDSANVYGHRSIRGRLPQRMADGKRDGFSANMFTGDIRRYSNVQFFSVSCPDPNDVDCRRRQQLNVLNGPAGGFQPIKIWQQAAYTRQFGTSPGVDQVFDGPGVPLCPLPFPNDVFCGRFGFPLGPGNPSEPLLQGFTDDPGFNVMRSVQDCFYGSQKTGGPTHGQGRRDLLLSIDDCRSRNTSLGLLHDIPNPFRGEFVPFGLDPDGNSVRHENRDGSLGDINPWLGRDQNLRLRAGAQELPFRPAPGLGYQDPSNGAQAQGIYYPPRALSQAIQKGEFSSIPFFKESELAWNRGQSQDQTKELKEFYLDMEFFDSRLWVRAGKQNIVWGKTELFRTTDQFNPQDLALASLPSLEESRIALWALRGVWSFYDVGPLQDVRVELALNYDEFQPSDLGVCGEPYTIDLVCSGAFGLQTHGILGLGVAGVVVPEDPWQDTSGIEVGGRLEWRWNRFSFALTDFWGYGDFPTVEQITGYSRNVDPFSGRPRRNTTQLPCPTGMEFPCLQVEDTNGDGFPDSAVDSDGDGLPDTLTDHHANQQIFAWICGMTIGVTELDPTACGNSVFNSLNKAAGEDPNLAATIGTSLASMVAGDITGLVLDGFQPGLVGPCRPPFVTACNPLIPLMNDVAFAGTPGEQDLDGPPLTVAEAVAAGFDPSFGDQILYLGGLQGVLTDEQEALLGCGAFYGTLCDAQGIDLLNAEASAMFQSWPGFEGTFFEWDSTDTSVAQPGTVGFQGGPVCTRYDGGSTVVLPGCNHLLSLGPDGRASTLDEILLGLSDDVFTPGYDPARDGTVTSANVRTQPPNTATGAWQHPFTGQPFQSEMAIASWNWLITLVAFARPPDRNGDGEPDRPPNQEEFDLDQPFREDGCSFAKPYLCFSVEGVIDFTSVQRATVRAGGNAQYGRRDFVWQIGTPLKVKFQKRNVLGFSVDWAEDLTKSNWSFETTWIEGVPMFDNDNTELITDVDTYNLTMSVDRPTFINFLNQNRTFFVNSQWFLQYVDGYRKGFPGEGPWNLLGTFTVTTGYFQDRMLPGVTFVYDLRSNSGAVLPQVSYRFTENFSTTFGMAIFYGREEFRTTAVTQIAPAERIGKHANSDAALRGLAPIKDRDEIFLLVKYTF